MYSQRIVDTFYLEQFINYQLFLTMLSYQNNCMDIPDLQLYIRINEETG